MIPVDANLLLCAYDFGAEQHEASRTWLDSVLSGSECVRFAWVGLWAFTRVSGNPRVFERTLPAPEAAATSPEVQGPGSRRCYDPAVEADDIRAFARRDWHAVAESKAGFWADRKRTMTAGEALAVAEALRIHVRALRPEWPDSRSREEDLAVHARVAEALRAVAVIRSR